jgi:hypothetical protein
MDADGPPNYDLELVLRKWYPVDRGRELRCFVRANELIGEQGSPLSDSFPSSVIHEGVRFRYIAARHKLLRILERS